MSIVQRHCRHDGEFRVEAGGVIDASGVREEHVTVIAADGHWRVEAGWHGGLDLRHTVVCPSLRDSHAHIFGDFFFPKFIAYGVTSVRDTGSPRNARRRLGRIPTDCSVPRPAVCYGGPILNQPDHRVKESEAVWSEWADVVSVLHEAREDGAVWQKLYRSFPADMLRKTVDLAHELGLLVAAHPGRGRAREMTDAGADSLEHVAALGWDVAAVEPPAKIDQHYIHACHAIWADDVPRNPHPWRPAVPVSPTLVVTSQLMAGMRGGWDQFDVPDWLSQHWRSLPATAPWTPAQWQAAEAALAEMQRYIAIFAAGGGSLLIGSDVPNPGVAPGVSLWQEIALLVDAGLPPLETLLMACTAPDWTAGSGDHDLMWLALDTALEGAARNWAPRPVDAVLLRGCLYQISLPKR